MRKSKIELLVIEKLHMNNKEQQNIQSEKTLTEIFKYNAEAGASEYYVMIHSTKPEDTYEEQLNAVLNTYDNLLLRTVVNPVVNQCQDVG